MCVHYYGSATCEQRRFNIGFNCQGCRVWNTMAYWCSSLYEPWRPSLSTPPSRTPSMHTHCIALTSCLPLVNKTDSLAIVGGQRDFHSGLSTRQKNVHNLQSLVLNLSGPGTHP